MKIRQPYHIKLVPAGRKPHPGAANSAFTGNTAKFLASEHLLHLAFDHSFLANIISVVSDGKIIAANPAAARLLGYSEKALLTKKTEDIFSSSDINFKLMMKRRKIAGHAAGDITIIKKGGKQLPCQITSVVFTGGNHIKKAITTLADSSKNIRRQKNADNQKEKQVTAERDLAQSKSDATVTRLSNLELKLDKEITAKEQSQSSSRHQRIAFEKEWEEETRLKGIEIADAIAEAKELERSDLGKELHDNVNQLLVASRLYLEIARKNKANRERYLSQSSQYTLTAIEEIRKLTKGLVDDEIKHMGLCNAIRNITRDIMEVCPIKIVCAMDGEIHAGVSTKLNLNIFRIVQEQLNNIIKHAQASEARIELSQNKDSITLCISDNGLGFDVTKKTGGIGIANIKSRAELYGGSAHFVSAPGKGCVLDVTFPMGGPSVPVH